ncbi:MAG: hypothetical protein ACLVES_06435 [Faecalibacterium prausnitzii]
MAGSKGSAKKEIAAWVWPYQRTEVLMFSSVKVGKEEELLGDVMTKAFQQGYDFRVGVAQGWFWVFRKRPQQCAGHSSGTIWTVDRGQSAFHLSARAVCA